MPLMSFDLEDGKPPVSFTLKEADTQRFVAFMAECNAALQAAKAAPAPTAPSEKQIEAAIWHLKGSHEDFATARRLIRRLYEGEMPPAAPQIGA